MKNPKLHTLPSQLLSEVAGLLGLEQYNSIYNTRGVLDLVFASSETKVNEDTFQLVPIDVQHLALDITLFTAITQHSTDTKFLPNISQCNLASIFTSLSSDIFKMES
ncbi:hypothetical protein J6590_054029 [Homalodisca vitripennis]|nr:hypothetical protein J6590_054029 [Homalodisca vitripennis]